MALELDSMNSCEALWDLLSAYADGQVTCEEASLVERHVESCMECARDLRFMRETAGLLADTPEVAPPPGLREAILSATIYRPTWQQRLREMGGRLLPARPIGGLALAGSAGVIVAAAYLAVSRPPERQAMPSVISPVSRPEKSVRLPLESPGGRKIALHKSNSAPNREHKVIVQLPRHPLPDGPRLAEVSVTSPALTETARRSRQHDRVAPAPAPHLVRNIPHKYLAPDVVPRLLPEREAPPQDMLTTSPIHTADMREPMGMPMGMGGHGDPMGNAPSSVHESAPPPVATSDRTRIVALTVSNSEPSNSGAMVSLADLRRKLRQQNEAAQVVHPELHLRGQHDVLDVLKSSF